MTARRKQSRKNWGGRSQACDSETIAGLRRSPSTDPGEKTVMPSKSIPKAVFAACLCLTAFTLAGCGKGNKQADALDNAAAQSDPAAAAELHNQADAIRESGSNGDVAAADGPAQNALQAAGDAAAANLAPASRPANQPTDKTTGLTR
jgi:hypothetical protein